MPIDINSLFADIIDTPEQRQQKLLQQGMMQGQLLASGLRGRAAALAPLAQMAGQLGVQRQEDLRRAVQPMIGIDPRTTGEKLQEQLGNIDTSTPQGLMQAARAIQSIDPVRAASLRQASAELTRDLEDRALNRKAAQSQIGIAEAQEKRRVEEAQYEQSRRVVTEAAAAANLDLAELQLRTAENQAAETEAQSQARETLRSELLNNIPDTEANAVTRALIPTMGLDQLQALGTGKDADITEIEIETVDSSGRSGTGIFVYDRNDIGSAPQFIAMKTYDDNAADYKPDNQRIQAFEELILNNENLNDLISDTFWGDDTDAPMRARLLASAVDRRVQSGQAPTEAQAIEDLRATSPENLRRGIIMPFGAATEQGEWGIAGEEGQPTPEPTPDPAPEPTPPPAPEAQANALPDSSAYEFNRELNNLYQRAADNPQAAQRLESLLNAKRTELANKRQALSRLSDVPESGAGLSASQQRARQRKIRLRGDVDLLEAQIRSYTPS